MRWTSQQSGVPSRGLSEAPASLGLRRRISGWHGNSQHQLGSALGRRQQGRREGWRQGQPGPSRGQTSAREAETWQNTAAAGAW